MSQANPAGERSYDELYERAQELDIEGRSDMNKDELEAAVLTAESGGPSDGRTGDPSVHNPQDASSGAAPRGNLEDDERPRARQTDPDVPNAGDSGRVVRAQQPDHSADEEGYVGVDPIYRNASDHKRRPPLEEKVPGAPKDDESSSDNE